LKPVDHPHVATGKVGVLIINLGTPDAPTPSAVRRYLAEFLSDPRVVEIPGLIWKPILHGIILNIRPAKTAKLYAKVWAQDSPLRAITRAQAETLKTVLKDVAVVDWAMRYGKPSIFERLDAMKREGCDRILIAPLYPQYSAATTATVVDTVFAWMKRARWQPSIRFLPPYYDDVAYIAAVANSLAPFIAEEPDAVLLSFHGMPRRTLDAGDPYHCQCQKTARLIRAQLGWPEDRFHVAFQSRFGRQEWLRPYADERVRELARQGVKTLVVACPGFSADCLETLEEVKLGLEETFRHSGGQSLIYVPCLNASPHSIELLSGLIRRELSGWI
jgi:protoporphyrin/coproporphyrin ferrochelatase